MANKNWVQSEGEVYVPEKVVFDSYLWCLFR